MDADEDIDAIRAQAKKVAASGVLGRSKFYGALLDYLVRCAEQGHTPKEIEIAAEVFSRGGDFDPSQDSMVRVYAHNLRQKLAHYYSADGAAEDRRITIPKGEYRLALAMHDPATGGERTEAGAAPVLVDWRRSARVVALVAAGAVAGIAVERAVQPASPVAPAYREVAASPFWKPVLDDDLPIVVVVGDYYIFGEMDAQGNVDRLVREFAINSSRDLDELLMLEPELASRYVDLNLTYLPSSAAFAMREFLRVLHTSDKPMRVVSMSALDADDLKANHVVYVGYISALDKLIDFVFSPSALAVGATYDELIDTVSGATYVSEAGNPAGLRSYRDYGLFSTFPGPSGNRFVVIAGTRDEGLMQSAQAASSRFYVEASLDALRDANGEVPDAFELLYEVAGFDRTNLDATIVHAAALHLESPWAVDVALPE